MLWRDTALQISTSDRFIPRFLLLPARVRQLLVSACVALGLVATTAQASSDPFQDIITLAGQGTPELALHIIDQQQTSTDPHAVEWAEWEKARILIYQQRRDWASVVRRTQSLSGNLPPTFIRWALTQGAAAQLELGQGAAARAWLLRLIWQVANVDSQLFAQWRRMVIHSYIVDGRVDDAYSALMRYQQDYGNSDVQTRLLQAHVLLLAGRAMEAAVLLTGTQVPAARALYLLAYLRSDGRPENILQEANQLAQQRMDAEPLDVALAVTSGIPAPSTDGQVPRAVAPGILPPATLAHPCASQDALERPSGDTCTSCTAWAVQAEAAQLIGHHERRVEALEHVLALCNGMACANAPGLFTTNSDSVWDAYVAYVQVLSNQQQLLMGDFAPWFAMAQSLVEEHPIRARALFAFLAMRADTVESRVRAHQQLTMLLGQLPQGAALMRALYMKLDRFH